VYKRILQWNLSLPVLMVLVFLLACKKDIPDDNGNGNNPPKEEEIVPFDKVPDTGEIVMYEVNMQAFGPDGTFTNVLQRLDSIRNLGVNVLWLMPVFPEGEEKGVGSPYCVRDYFDVNPDHGTPDELKKFVQEVHKREMAVILDWVANHTSWDNEWILNESWYVHDANGNIIPPPGTNWQDVAELNYDNPEMRSEMIRAMKHWVTTFNIDGFRCDAVDFVPFDFWKEALDELKALPGRKLILLAESGKKESFEAGFQMNYSWDFQSKLTDVFRNGTTAAGIINTHNTETANLPEGAWKLRYITNHDICAWEDAPPVQYGSAEGSVAAFVINAFLGGVPLMYTGQEIAHPSPISFFDRNPIDWSKGANIYGQYKSIMQVRNEYRNLLSGSLKTYTQKDAVLFRRLSGADELLLVVNVRNKNVALTLPDELHGTNWTNTLSGEKLLLPTEWTLQAYQYCILKNEF